MSGIIWGCILKNNKEAKNISEIMQSYIGKYKIDKYNTINYNNLSFGCGIQFITSESEKEVLPYFSKEDNLIITADAIIDNRKDLLDKLNLCDKDESDYTDSEYILLAYKKWGEECPKYLIGDYSFVIYDISKDMIFCAKDHTGKRTFYYYNNDDIFAFSTLCSPLFPVIGKVKYNERYIADYLAIDGIMSITEGIETIYQDILQLEAYHTLKLHNNNIVINDYWNPCKDVKLLKCKNEEDYIKGFLEVYKESVNCRLRTTKDVALKLSSGLDSTSVAAIAAKSLKDNNKILKSFTSVPMESFKEEKVGNISLNEKKGVEEVIKYIGNIEGHFCSSENLNPYTDIDRLIEIYESPYKVIENSYWIYDLTKIAKSNNCNIILTGQFGNSTISFGDYYINQKELISKGRLIKAYKEIKGYSKVYNIPRRLLIKDVIKKVILKKSDENNKNFDRFEYSPINKELIKKYNVEKRLNEMGANPDKLIIKSHNEVKKFISNSLTFASITLFDTKMALATGTVNRDPTRDKRVIEYCISLPIDIFMKDGIDRYFIRKSMEGLVPDSIRMNVKIRGLQAADWIERLRLDNWDLIYSEIKQAINDNENNKYFDLDKLNRKIKEIETLDDNTDVQTLRMFFVVLIICKFFNYNKKKYPNNF